MEQTQSSGNENNHAAKKLTLGPCYSSVQDERGLNTSRKQMGAKQMDWFIHHNKQTKMLDSTSHNQIPLGMLIKLIEWLNSFRPGWVTAWEDIPIQYLNVTIC